jgi:hypothetical protein
MRLGGLGKLMDTFSGFPVFTLRSDRKALSGLRSHFDAYRNLRHRHPAYHADHTLKYEPQFDARLSLNPASSTVTTA